MLHLRKAICLILLALTLAQPVFTETEAPTTAPTEPIVPDIVTAVREVENVPTKFGMFAPVTEELQWLRDLTSAPLYAMASDGSWTPVLARALPEDVTKDYVNSYNIPADSSRGYAFRILLNGDARWEDGLFITAIDYIDSIQKLLSNKETSENWLFLANAAAIREGKMKSSSDVIPLKNAGFSSISEAWGAGYREFFVDTSTFWGLDGGWKSVSDRTRMRDYAMPGGLDEGFVSPAYLYNNYLMDGTEHHRYLSRFIGIAEKTNEPYTMDDLGLIRVNDYELIIIVQSPTTPSLLMQNLQKLLLFRADTAQYLSCGPYYMVSAAAGQIVLQPNPHWWRAPDSRGYDRIICQKIGT